MIPIITLGLIAENKYLQGLSNPAEDHEACIKATQELFRSTRSVIEGTINAYYGEETGKQVMTIAKAVFNESGTFLGVLAIDINTDFMQEYFANIKLKNTGYAILVNNDGSIIVNNEKFKEDFGSELETVNELSFWNEAKGQETGSQELTSANKSMFVSYVTNGETQWKLIANVDESEIHDDVRGMEKTIIIVAIVCLVLACIAGTTISITIVKQIKKACRVINKVANGDFTEKIHVDSNDEFGELGDSFNIMIDNVSELIHNLESTSKVLLDSVNNILILK